MKSISDVIRVLTDSKIGGKIATPLTPNLSYLRVSSSVRVSVVRRQRISSSHVSGVYHERDQISGRWFGPLHRFPVTRETGPTTLRPKGSDVYLVYVSRHKCLSGLTRLSQSLCTL